MTRVMRYFFILLIIAVLNLNAESQGYKEWLAYRELLRQDSSVVRYYTFEDVKDSKSRVADLKNSGNNLVFVPLREGGQTLDDLKLVDGRFPEKKAVRLDRGWYQGPAFYIEGKQFTLSCWFRRQGPGSIASASKADEGAIISVAGWDRGWRIATVYDDSNTLRFCLGQPGGCEKVMSDIAISDNSWHHLGVTWDGKKMLIYFNGTVVGKREYSGRYTPSRSGDVLKLGYAGGAVGSVVLDIDEVVIYNTSLTGQEVRKLGRIVSPANEILGIADNCIKSGDYNGARKEYGKLKGMKSVEYGREIALFNIAESYRLEKDYASAHKTYREIFSLPDLTVYYRIYGLFRQAEVYLEQKDYNNARKLYADIAKTEGAPENHIFNAQLYTGDTYRQERQYTQARNIYVRLLKQQDASSHPHDNYRLELADRLGVLEGLADGQEEKSQRQKRLAWVNSPKEAMYVSLQGNDNNSGTKERPFATIKRAQEEVRKIKAAKGIPRGGIAVYLRGGKYFIDGSIVFEGEQDSGTAESPVVYRSYPGEDVRIIGGKQITGFKPLADPEILRRLPEESRKKVWVADLKEAGINDYGSLQSRGGSFAHNPAAMELFFNGKPMNLARWPNEGWLQVTDLVDPEGDGKYLGANVQKGRFKYSGDRPKRWTEEKDIWAAGYFNVVWNRIHARVVDIDTESRIVNLAPDLRGVIGTPISVKKDWPYYFYNVLGELTLPEEFYIDRDTGKLYFYPPDKPVSSEIIVSTLNAPVMEMLDVSNLVLFGLTVECTWRNAIEMKGSRNNLIAGCTIRNTGQYAVVVDGGWRNGVVGCDIYDTGEGGITFTGGNREKLIPSGHYAENNHIQRFNRFDGGYRPALKLTGIGNRVSHNLISDSPHQAIMHNYNNNIIEFNEIYDVVHEAADAGAIYIYGEPRYMLSRGTVTRYNFIHHFTKYSSPVRDLTTHPVIALYNDALNAGMSMIGNIIYMNTSWGGTVNGPDYRLENNIYVDTMEPVYLAHGGRILSSRQKIVSAWGFSGIRRWEYDFLEPVNFKQPPWSIRYPQLRDIFKLETDLGFPRNTVIERNISAGESQRFLTISSPRSEEIPGANTIRDNVEVHDPLFVNPEQLDFRLRTGSPVYGMMGFDPIPFEKIGVYEDPLRASWPVKRSAAGKYYAPEGMEILPAERVAVGPLPFTVELVEYGIKRKTSGIKIDGRLEKEEWAGLDRSKAMVIEKIIWPHTDKYKKGDRSYVWMSYDDEYLYIGVENMPNPFTPDMPESEKHLSRIHNELVIEGVYGERTWWWQGEIDTGPVYIFSGHSNGRFEVNNNFRMPLKVLKSLIASVGYKAVMINEEDCHWTAEWKIPLAALNINLQDKSVLRFNMGGPKRGGWFAWVPTGGSMWRLDNGGSIKFIK